METMEFLAGERIEVACTRLATAANVGDTVYSASFNGIDLLAAPGISAESLVQYYHEESDRQHQAYLASPQGKADAIAAQIRRDSMQRDVDALMLKLPTVHGHADVLEWLAAFAIVADHTGVNKDYATVLDRLRMLAYEANANTGNAYAGNDRDNVARYIVGQAMDYMQKGLPPHSVLIRFVAEWQKME